MMNSSHADSKPSIMELPAVVRSLFERAQRPLLPGGVGPVAFFVRYLRRKPGRGLAIIYHVDMAGRRGVRPQGTSLARSISLTLEETSLTGTELHFTVASAQQAWLDTQPSGALRLRELGLSVQAFPTDAGLPALAACCDTGQGSALFQGLETAAQRQFGDSAWQLLSASAAPVRYKPGNRCVMRYQLVGAQPGTHQSAAQNLTLFGKVYASPHQARTVYALQQELYEEQQQGDQGAPLLPRPLGLIEALGLTLHEAVESAGAGEPGHIARSEPVRPGTAVLRPHLVRGRGGNISVAPLPEEAIERTARALTRLHTSGLSLHGQIPRTAAQEVTRLRERASLLANCHPTLADQVQRLAHHLAERLETAQPDSYRPVHGGFKPSQLLIAGQQVIVVDFDGCCPADPALDVGYFLAYLRPSGLWYQRPGSRRWFEQAAAAFRTAYGQGMRASGSNREALEGILARSPLYEAALLFKIATRRVHRLNSPRPQELRAVLSEIDTCLAGELQAR